MSLFSNIKKLLNIEKGKARKAPDSQGAFKTLPKPATASRKEKQEKPVGGTVVRQEKDLRLTSLGDGATRQLGGQERHGL
jgi:hypothetical protein